MTRRPDQRGTRPSDETRGLSRATSAHSGDRAASAHSGAARAEPARRGTSGARAEPVETSGPTRADQRGGRLVALELNQWRPAARPELTTAGRARPARSETSGAGHRTSDISAGRARPARKRDQRGARPAAQATGRATGRATEAVDARDDRRRYESCRRVRRPAALQKLSARETTGRATEAVGARDYRGDQPAE